MNTAIDCAPRARRTDPQTSHNAAKRAERFASTHKGRIIEALRHGAATAHRLSQLTGLTVVQIDRRLPECEVEGLARPVVSGGAYLVSGGFRVWEAV